MRFSAFSQLFDGAFRQLNIEERGRCEDPLRRSGSLLSGLHAEHLHSCDCADETGCGGHNRSGHQRSNVRKGEDPNNSTGQENPVRCSFVLSDHFPVWVNLWVGPKRKKPAETTQFRRVGGILGQSGYFELPDKSCYFCARRLTALLHRLSGVPQIFIQREKALRQSVHIPLQ